MRKFKHKLTGNIAVETSTEKNYKVSEPKNFTVPKWIVENSGDWEEILPTTKFGVSIKGVYPLIISSDSYHLYTGYVWFDTREEQLKYIDENQPKYSKKDIKEFVQYTKGNISFDKYPNFDYWINHVRK